jgi:hypothetical protein
LLNDFNTFLEEKKSFEDAIAYPKAAVDVFYDLAKLKKLSPVIRELFDVEEEIPDAYIFEDFRFCTRLLERYIKDLWQYYSYFVSFMVNNPIIYVEGKKFIKNFEAHIKTLSDKKREHCKALKKIIFELCNNLCKYVEEEKKYLSQYVRKLCDFIVECESCIFECDVFLKVFA